MLEIARRDGARFLVTSTSECYGDPLEHPQVETYWGNVNPVGERSCYDESKRYAEAMTMAYSRSFGVRTKSHGSLIPTARGWPWTMAAWFPHSWIRRCGASL